MTSSRQSAVNCCPVVLSTTRRALQSGSRSHSHSRRHGQVGRASFQGSTGSVSLTRAFGTATAATATASPSSGIQFDVATLDEIERRLQHNEQQAASSGRVRWKLRGGEGGSGSGKAAAVVVPLCTVDGQAAVLLTVRAAHLRAHGGDVAFPGGAADADDASLLHTALREAREEIGLGVSPLSHTDPANPADPADPTIPASLRVLGRLPDAPNRGFTALVSPFVVAVGPVEPDKIQFNRDEVAAVFAVSIDQLLDPAKRDTENFRGLGVSIASWPVGNHRIWGLTAYILDNFLKSIIVPIVQSRSK
eukprot:jgi/Hompol1/6072/HPOL_002753-RA